MGQVFSYIWRRIRLYIWLICRRNIKAETSTITTTQNDQYAPMEEHGYYITIPDEDTYMAQPDVITEVVPFIAVNLINDNRVEYDEKEKEEEEVVKKVIQVVVTEDVTSQVFDRAIDDYGVSEETVPFIGANLKNDSVEQEEEKEEEVVEEVIQEVVEKEVSSQVLTSPNKENVFSEETVNRIGPYSSIQKILLVGEGDFSFSTSLAKAFGSASNMIATSLNSQEYLTSNYNKFLPNKRELESRGCRVIHGVDARNMIQHSVLRKLKFEIIIYNFPHTGRFGGSDADLRKNQNLIRGFVRNAMKMIDEDGEIHITHKSNSFFRRWDIPKIGCDEGLYLIQAIRFKRSLYPGYCTKNGFKDDKNFNCNPSKTYKFGLRPKSV
ncbi:hypothetical protein KSS87_011629 [Heliosperma pusillum]|nr:hypothetical protein KSS87_011629 [Heliosperma pusillum]